MPRLHSLIAYQVTANTSASDDYGYSGVAFGIHGIAVRARRTAPTLQDNHAALRAACGI